MNRLKQLRERYGLSLRDVCDKTNVNIGSLSRFERGVSGINSETLISLCEFFGVTADYLLGTSDIGFNVKYEDKGVSFGVTAIPEEALDCFKDVREMQEEMLRLRIDRVVKGKARDEVEKRDWALFINNLETFAKSIPTPKEPPKEDEKLSEKEKKVLYAKIIELCEQNDLLEELIKNKNKEKNK